MLKIGVITHWRSKDNYGQTLQIYALQNVLKKMQTKPYLIRYHSVGPQRSKGEQFLRLIGLFNPYKIITYWRTMRNNKIILAEDLKHDRKIGQFFKDYISVSPKEYSREQLMADPPYADIYICGSDQVWNKLDGTFFLDFVTDGMKVAYAASFGSSIYSRRKLKRVNNFLKNFDGIGVREISGLHICKTVGRNDARLVPDPTLLIDQNEYLKIAKDPLIDQEYVFVYLLGNGMDFNISDIYTWANKKNLKVVYAPAQGMDDEYPHVYPDIEGWLGLINNAKYVITNSFHGSVFSIIFKKQFITIPVSGNSKTMNDRLSTLFSQIGIEEKRLTTCLDRLDETLSYDRIEKRLQEYRQTGLNFLTQLIRDNE